MIEKGNIKRIWIITPVAGSAIFIVLYMIASFYYPGGSQFDKNSVGFSWLNNYWCNLLNESAINGQINPARPIALTAMFILCLSLAIFWSQFPTFTAFKKSFKLIVQTAGIIGVTIGFFLFTEINHDLITNLASAFGLIATVGTFIGLYKNGWHNLFYFGILNCILVVLNNVLYYNKGLINCLPLMQKITFLAFLFWISGICIKMYRHQ